jgi:3-phosphoshikimate 1-carboxyvinyltransferase
MGRIINPLTQMGAPIDSREGCPPLHIQGASALDGIHYDLPVASAQVKSSVLLAGLYASGRTSVTEPAPTRDHTERMLTGFGYSVSREKGVISVAGGGVLRGTEIDIPADISSAAFFMVGASIAPGSDLILEHVGLNPTRDGVITILRAMGANIEVSQARTVGGEPVADLRIRYAPLRGIDIPVEEVPLAIDELPAILVAAACAEGVTVLRGAEELRVKESDRIASMAEGLTQLGIGNTVAPDGITVVGGTPSGGVITTHHDHRIAMSFAMAALRASDPIIVTDCAHVATSFPGFAELAANTGLRLTVTAS